MNGKELVKKLQALPLEEQELPVVYDYYDTGDGMEMERELEIISLKVEKSAIHLTPYTN